MPGRANPAGRFTPVPKANGHTVPTPVCAGPLSGRRSLRACSLGQAAPARGPERSPRAEAREAHGGDPSPPDTSTPLRDPGGLSSPARRACSDADGRSGMSLRLAIHERRASSAQRFAGTLKTTARGSSGSDGKTRLMPNSASSVCERSAPMERPAVPGRTPSTCVPAHHDCRGFRRHRADYATGTVARSSRMPGPWVEVIAPFFM